MDTNKHESERQIDALKTTTACSISVRSGSEANSGSFVVKKCSLVAVPQTELSIRG